MPTLKDGIYYSKHQTLKGIYKILNLSDEEIQLLLNITPRQRKKFESDKKLIPYPLLQLFWRLGFLPIIEEPTQGMRIPVFIEFLSKGEYKNKQNQFKGIWLRDKIVEEECPEIIITNETYLKVRGEGSKWVPVSYYKDIPGTIFK